jgi:hypothetical protein
LHDDADPDAPIDCAIEDRIEHTDPNDPEEVTSVTLVYSLR